MTTFGTLSGRLTITIGGQSVDIGRVDVPIDGRVNGSELALKVNLREVQDVVETVFATTTPTPEPEPWPTAGWIVADVTDDGAKLGRRLLYREPDAATYWTADGMSMYPDYDGDTLTNVVEVTPVPVAEWEAWGRCSCADCAVALINATEALGVVDS